VVLDVKLVSESPRKIWWMAKLCSSVDVVAGALGRAGGALLPPPPPPPEEVLPEHPYVARTLEVTPSPRPTRITLRESFIADCLLFARRAVTHAKRGVLVLASAKKV
jgi:hypothetical protein